MNTPLAFAAGLVVGGAIVCVMPNLREITKSGTPWWAKRLLKGQDDIVATLTEAVAGWREYTNALKAQVKASDDAKVAAQNVAQDAVDRAKASADALAAFQADDAATDASQLAEQAQKDADEVQAALDEAKAIDVPPAEVPPVVDQPVDGIPLDPPTEPGTGTDIPTGNPPEDTPVSEDDPAPAEDAPLDDDPESTPPSESTNPLA